VLGAVALNCGGLLIDHGWLRILGGGGRGLPDLATVNGLGDPANTPGPPPYLTVAFDELLRFHQDAATQITSATDPGRT
jgi:hypothetical protein